MEMLSGPSDQKKHGEAHTKIFKFRPNFNFALVAPAIDPMAPATDPMAPATASGICGANSNNSPFLALQTSKTHFFLFQKLP